MTSFVTTATTMFNRFPLRHSKKEPTIGMPILVDSSRQDLLNGHNNESEKGLPPLPNEHFYDFGTGAKSPTRYTTTPNFEASPIMPSKLTPPAFLSVRNHASYHGTESKETKRKPSKMGRKHASASVMEKRPSSPQQHPKHTDLLEAVNATHDSQTYSSYQRTLSGEKKTVTPPEIVPVQKLLSDEKPASREHEFKELTAEDLAYLHPRESDMELAKPAEKSIETPAEKPVERAPRLRDSIVPTLNPIDKSFLGDLLQQNEEEEEEESEFDTMLSPSMENPLAGDLIGPNLRVKGDERSNLIASPATSNKTLRRKSRSLPFIDVSIPPSRSIELDSPVSDDAQEYQPKRIALPIVQEVTPPPTPPSPEEHLALLERRRDVLNFEMRKLNREMSAIKCLLPPNPATHCIVERKQLNASLRRIEEALATIKMDLHDTGMMLHRAWRRKDIQAGYEAPSVLWVRRVDQQ